MAKILILAREDNENVAQVFDELSKKRHQVDLLHLAERIPEVRFEIYSSIVLDLRSRNFNRVVDTCRYIKKLSRKPLLVLAGNQCHCERIAGLSSGADDFMCDPVDLSEMEAKLRAILRRYLPPPGPALQIADMHLEPSACRVRRGAQYIDLFPMEYKLLEFFMKHPDTTFSSEMLHQRLWESSKAQTLDTVRTHIKTLRRKIDAGRSHALIKTIHGKGYRFISPRNAILQDNALPA